MMLPGSGTMAGTTLGRGASWPGGSWPLLLCLRCRHRCTVPLTGGAELPETVPCDVIMFEPTIVPLLRRLRVLCAAEGRIHAR